MTDILCPSEQRSPSAGKDLADKDSPANEKSGEDAFPFSVQSQESVTNGEPPAIDNAKLAAQKRRRTSPEDQATLEAEYKANPKPDKGARLEIVKKVSLGEKAVQIWFQNRRQNTRRKSRPLLPHEIAAFGLGGMAALSAEAHENLESNVGTTASFDSSPNVPLAAAAAGQSDGNKIATAAALNSAAVINAQSLKTAGSQPELIVASEHPKIDVMPMPRIGGQLNPFSMTKQSPTILPPLPSTQPGYLANRRSASSGYFDNASLARSSSFDSAIILPPIISQPYSKAVPNSMSTKPTSAEVRLSMSLDGKASLVSTLLIPSPPRPQSIRPTSAHASTPDQIAQRRRGLLQRSHSALPFDSSSGIPSISGITHAGCGGNSGPLTSSPSIASTTTSRLPTGRSRDARTWEFCASPNARDELTQQAENESRGSAAAAIYLLRSNSGNLGSRNSPLGANANKRNTPTRPQTRDPVIDDGKKRAKLSRAHSSLARMQNIGDRESSKGRNATNTIHRFAGDEDKENWVPEAGGHRRVLSGRPTGSQMAIDPTLQTTSILGSASNASSVSGSSVARLGQKSSRRRVLGDAGPVSGNNGPSGAGSMRSRGRKDVHDRRWATNIHEDDTADSGAKGTDRPATTSAESSPDDDVREFMKDLSPSKKGDLDCIQGLLSLSQGAWR